MSFLSVSDVGDECNLDTTRTGRGLMIVNHITARGVVEATLLYESPS